MANPRSGGGHPAVERVIHDRLDRAGRLTFAEFMQLALYHPEGGYYSHVGVGRDFRTAPQTSPGFAHVLGSVLAAMWRALDSPSRFYLLEPGAGDGRLSEEIKRYLGARSPEVSRATRVVSVDRVPARHNSGQLDWIVGDAEALPFQPIVGCILTNELFDALPVHRIVVRDGQPRELWVVKRERGLAFQEGELSTPELEQWLGVAASSLQEGHIVDVSLAAPRVMRQFAEAIGRGFVLTIDYGGSTAELLAPYRRGGTLLAYRRHRVVDEPLAAPGEQDLTAHVDFDVLRETGERAGLETIAYTSQRDFLLNAGLIDWVGRLDPRVLTPADLFNARAAAAELVRPELLGKLRVLLQARNVDHASIDAIARHLSGGERSRTAVVGGSGDQ